jgi:hypothetical protein
MLPLLAWISSMRMLLATAASSTCDRNMQRARLEAEHAVQLQNSIHQANVNIHARAHLFTTANT